jgi:cytochrome b6-f complex iron-sulfur subunit
MKRNSLSRRAFFLKAAGLAGAAALIKSSDLFGASPPTADTSKPAPLPAPSPALPDSSAARKPALTLTYLTDKQAGKISGPGDCEVFKFNDKKILVARVSPTEIVAMSAVCTHEGCTVKYKPKENDVKCWCHGSTYDLKGRVVKGPAKQDLVSYPVEIKDNKIGIAL